MRKVSNFTFYKKAMRAIRSSRHYNEVHGLRLNPRFIGLFQECPEKMKVRIEAELFEREMYFLGLKK